MSHPDHRFLYTCDLRRARDQKKQNMKVTHDEVTKSRCKDRDLEFSIFFFANLLSG